MRYIKKILIIVLLILTLNLYLPKMSLAQQVSANTEILNHEPQIWATPEEDIPTVKVKKTSAGTWLIIIALLIGTAGAFLHNAGGTGEF
jgi:hypothetical protein